VPPCQAHVRALAADLRREDRETAALCGIDPFVLYWTMMSRSPHCATALVDGEPAAMWGASVDSFVAAEKAHLWFVVAASVDRPAHIIARGAVPFVNAMQTCYSRLVTTVAWGHERDHRWVRWLGFRRAPHEDRMIGEGRFIGYER